MTYEDWIRQWTEDVAANAPPVPGAVLQPGLGVPAASVDELAAVAPRTEPPEIEMPAVDVAAERAAAEAAAQPKIGFPRPWSEDVDQVAQLAADQQIAASMVPPPPETSSATGAAVTPAPAQPGIGIPQATVDELAAAHDQATQEQQAQHEQDVDAQIAGSFRAPSLQQPSMPFEDAANARAQMTSFEAAQDDALHQQLANEEATTKRLELARRDREEADAALQARLEAQQRATAERAKINDEAKALANQKVGPKDWFAEGGLARGIFAMTAAVVGGLVAGRTGGANEGLAAIERGIDRWVAAKQADRAHQRALLDDRSRGLEQQVAQDAADAHENEVLRKAAYERSLQQIEIEQQNYDPEGTRARALDDVRRQLIAKMQADEVARHQALAKQYEDLAKEARENERLRLEQNKDRRADEAHRLAMATGKAKLAGLGAKKAEDVVQTPEYFAQRGLVAPPVPMSEKQYKAWQPQKKASQEIAANRAPSGMSKEERENLVPGVYNDAEGKVPFIATGRPEDVAKLRNQVAAAKLIVKRMDDALRTRTGWSSDTGNSDERNKLKAQWGNVKVDAKNLLDLGAITASDVPLIEGVVGTDDPSQWKDPQAGILEARRLVEDRINTLLEASGREPTAPRWHTEPPSTKKPEETKDDLIFKRAQDEAVGSLRSFSADMIDKRPLGEEASEEEVHDAFTRANPSPVGDVAITPALVAKRGRGIPPGIKAAIERWGAEARNGDEKARAYLSSLTTTGGNAEVKAAAQAELMAALAPREPEPVEPTIARDTLSVPPKGKR